MTEFVHVGRHADVLANGRSIGPSDRVDGKDLDLDDGDHAGEDQHLVDGGALVDVKTFEPSLDDLKARASELEIEGRSKMNAKQLREAIAAHDAELAERGSEKGGPDAS